MAAAAAAVAVAAASVAFSSLHLSSSIFRQPSLSCRNIRRISLIRASSSSTPSTEFEFNISFGSGSDKSKTDSQEPGRRVSRRAPSLPIMIPWIVRGEDGQIKFQTTPPAQLLHDMANAKTTSTSPKKIKMKMKMKKATPNNKESNLTSQPKYSKAARRFYNENFRDPPQRLAKVLASAGVASRRSCEELIFEGLVTVNGSVCNTPQTKVDLAKDVVYVKGNRLSKKLPPKVYLALNKPKGYICSSGEKETKSVLTLVDDYLQSWDRRSKGLPKPRLFTIGRLDVATTGLIIVTNDGDFAHKLTHPSSTLSKEYIAVVEGSVSKRQLVAISEGTVIDGVRCIPDSVELLPAQAGVTRARLRIVVHDGRNHEVRELVKNAGLEIHSLKRLRIGGYRLPPDLGLGKHVELNQGDLKALGGMLQPTAAS